jgi:hypothetical protein
MENDGYATEQHNSAFSAIPLWDGTISLVAFRFKPEELSFLTGQRELHQRLGRCDIRTHGAN